MSHVNREFTTGGNGGHNCTGTPAEDEEQTLELSHPSG